MKCPHCNYEDGWSGELLGTVNGKTDRSTPHRLNCSEQTLVVAITAPTQL